MTRNLKTHCELCEREFYSNEGRFPVGKPTVHHLVPKQKYRGKWSEVETIMICSRCHKQLHKCYDNVALKTELNDIESLKASSEMQKFIAWLRKEKRSEQ